MSLRVLSRQHHAPPKREKEKRGEEEGGSGAFPEAGEREREIRMTANGKKRSGEGEHLEWDTEHKKGSNDDDNNTLWRVSISGLDTKEILLYAAAAVIFLPPCFRTQQAPLLLLLLLSYF